MSNQKTRIFSNLLSCVGIVCTFAFQNVEADCRTLIPGVQLSNYVMSALTIGDIDSCYNTCAAKPGCQSINYYKHKSLCEMNAMTIEGAPQMTVINDDSVYFEIPEPLPPIEIEKIKFARESITDYVVVQRPALPRMTSLTLCLWMRVADFSGHHRTMISYAVPRSYNEIVLNNPTSMLLWIGNSMWNTNVAIKDYAWHHICTTWDSSTGRVALYKDGAQCKLGYLKKGHVIKDGGILIIGQEQDRYGGGFQKSQSFVGELFGISIWDKVLQSRRIDALSTYCNGTTSGNVLKWNDVINGSRKGQVEIITSKCPSKPPAPRNCAELNKRGFKITGVYTIDPDDKGKFEVYCDQKTEGGGWTVFQRRQDGSVDFFRGWNDYKNGFGDLKGEFWLGLDKIHRLTNKTRNRLRVELDDFKGNTAYAEYDYFAVGNERDTYRLSIGSYIKGTAGDSLSKHRGMAFSTKDRDNDIDDRRFCAQIRKGAWWYHNCHQSNLNGYYYGGKQSSFGDGVNWETWTGDHHSAKRTEMKIRPV